MVDKYGYDEACNIQRNGDKTPGGKANKGIAKSEEHKKKISNSLRARGEAG